MIKVIDGKRYNSDTATCIFQHTNGKYDSDFSYRSKTLYQTAKGAFFLLHYGGAMSDMSVPVGNNGRGGSADIEPVSDDDAFGFLEAHSDDDDAMAAIEKFFADRVEEA